VLPPLLVATTLTVISAIAPCGIEPANVADKFVQLTVVGPVMVQLLGDELQDDTTP
jgi:hypothetical protein